MFALRTANLQISRQLLWPVIAARLISTESKTGDLNAAAVKTDNVQTPVPKHIEGSDLPAHTTSGAPESLHERLVRIYRPTRNAMTSGKDQTRFWKIDFDSLEMADRWENQLIGWASSADPMQSVRLKFTSKDAAIRFAEKQGWNYYVQEPKTPKFRKKEYKANFLYNPEKLRWIQTK
ncbi:ndufs4 NADH dehydrogenase Fe-S protein subunit [Mycoemilia scoparia]|uniref:NADH dehydrogenase [ubiquinone] iron-sulfur protein 4, mitochondrial n=1 Tax=Mycoemilia scoparia TaxID=417184 RepID=A0A9W8A933_9FUNG|nr:ndufs4 NADH dehydrogenase Fe-S protein subunit [Mycoemilia scoparia]